jgi:hypothetical protein
MCKFHPSTSWQRRLPDYQNNVQINSNYPHVSKIERIFVWNEVCYEQVLRNLITFFVAVTLLTATFYGGLWVGGNFGSLTNIANTPIIT